MSTNIVVVEPDSAIQTLIAEWLTADGHSVKQFAHLSAATDAIASADALCLDLPFLRHRHEASLAVMLARHPGLIVLGLSTGLSRSLGKDSSFARSLGLVGVIAKPSERQELLDAVNVAVRRRNA